MEIIFYLFKIFGNMCDCTQWIIYIVGVMAGPECCFQTSLNSELLCIHGVSIHAWTQEMVTCAQVQEITQEMAQVLIPRSNEIPLDVFANAVDANIIRHCEHCSWIWSALSININMPIMYVIFERLEKLELH